jgi:hypothetical protein
MRAVLQRRGQGSSLDWNGRVAMRLRNVLIFLGVVALLWVVVLGGWPFITWSPLNCRCEDVDVTSGRLRYQQYLLGFCLSETIEDTCISRLVSPNGSELPAIWHRVNTFSPLVHYSPHHSYHAAIGQIKLVEGMLSTANFTLAAKQRIAKDILFLWQRDGSYFSVGDYLDQLEVLVEKSIASPQKPINVADLPSTAEAPK